MVVYKVECLSDAPMRARAWFPDRESAAEFAARIGNPGECLISRETLLSEDESHALSEEVETLRETAATTRAEHERVLAVLSVLSARAA